MAPVSKWEEKRKKKKKRLFSLPFNLGKGGVATSGTDPWRERDPPPPLFSRCKHHQRSLFLLSFVYGKLKCKGGKRRKLGKRWLLNCWNWNPSPSRSTNRILAQRIFLMFLRHFLVQNVADFYSNLLLKNAVITYFDPVPRNCYHSALSFPRLFLEMLSLLIRSTILFLPPYCFWTSAAAEIVNFDFKLGTFSFPQLTRIYSIFPGGWRLWALPPWRGAGGIRLAPLSPRQGVQDGGAVRAHQGKVWHSNICEFIVF